MTVSSTNCERDDNVPLLQLSNIQDIPDIHQENIGPLRIVSTEYTNEYLENRIFKDNAMAYVAGYLLRKAYELHKCDECVHLCSENSLAANNTFLLFKAYNTGSSAYSGLTVPSDEMLSYVNKLEDAFISFFVKLEKSKGIGRDLLELLGKIELDIPCKEFNRVFLIRLFVRMRIYYCLKYVNRELVTTKRKNRKYIKLVHL